MAPSTSPPTRCCKIVWFCLTGWLKRWISPRDGRIKSAGLDVWYNYPKDKDFRADTPPSSRPFGELDNVVMSPHRGGESMDNKRLRAEGLAALLNAALAGETLPNRVDIRAGY